MNGARRKGLLVAEKSSGNASGKPLFCVYLRRYWALECDITFLCHTLHHCMNAACGIVSKADVDRAIQNVQMKDGFLLDDTQKQAAYTVYGSDSQNVTVITGGPGSGKTTMLRCLNFLERPDTGVIRVNGETMWDAADPATQRESEVRKKRLHFGLVFQNFNLFPQYTALENVMLAGELLAKEQPDYKANKKAIHAQLEAQARDLLAQMGLSERAGHYPHQLSGGQQQRVAIARALALHPDILCFDEPTSALDPELTGEVLRVLRDLADRKTTMIIVTHEMHFARDVADRIMFMDGGVVVEEGPARQLIDHPQEERTKQFLARFAENN